MTAESRLAALKLAADPDYRILHRLKPQRHYDTAAPDERLMIGAVIDTEATGVDPNSDQLIEMAIVPFTYREDGTIVEVLEEKVYSGLNDPCVPLRHEVREITGLTDEQLEGQAFDLPRIAELVSECQILIAHNAGYDRRLLERFSPIFASKVWACTIDLLPWFEEGVRSTKLDYILTQYGLFFDAHRAEADARALLHLIAQPLLRTGRQPLALMRERLRTPTYAIWLTSTPYNAKSEIYRSGFRWVDSPNAPHRGYRKIAADHVVAHEVEQAVALLRRLKLSTKPEVVEISPLDRFTDRA